jgi:glycosyltransferase involved in cell wall biosynthesis/2-polyprenyl-3-methyl-5-hydroxy-6-metoxy-1,4-benzoquinol methylase
MNKPQCWCGNSSLEKYSPDYSLCPVCGTLVCSHADINTDTKFTAEKTDFYGQEYWFEYQPGELNYPNLITRSREDLSERALYWLRSILRFCLPPARSLELGSAHGGFVALLRQAGFDAAGLELSQWVVQFAEEHFQIPMYLGPIEDQSIEPGSLDLIILMDVLEHFPDPGSTIQHCLNLLKPDGIFIIQTPEYKRSYFYDELVQTNQLFLRQLKPVEHVYLFSQESIKKFFGNQGVDHVDFIPPCFPYDMFLVASRVPLRENSPAEVENALLSTPGGRIALALLDLDGKYGKLEIKLTESEADRMARLKNIQTLQSLLDESEADRAARLVLLQQLEKQFQAKESDLSELQRNINELEGKLQESDADRAARLKDIHQLESLLRESEADRTARLGNIQELEKLLRESEADRLARLQNIRELEKLLRESEADRAARLVTITELEKRLTEISSDRDAQLAALRDLELRLDESEEERLQNQALISSLESRIDELAGDLQSFNEEKQQLNRDIHRLTYFVAVYEHELSRFPVNYIRRVQNKVTREREKIIKRLDSASKKRKPKLLDRIVIDLTPVVPGGENGGAKLLATTLTWQFSREIAPECDFILLTSSDTHDELAWLDAENVHRTCINQRLVQNLRDSGREVLNTPEIISKEDEDFDEHVEGRSTADLPAKGPGSQITFSGGIRKVVHFIGTVLEHTLPRSLYGKIYQIYRSDIKSPGIRNVLSDLKADLLFCPFTAPLYYSPGIPTVIIVHDLQFLTYPQFFNPDEVYHTDLYFRKSCQVADRLVCVSEFTRKSVLQTAAIAPERVETIHTSFCNPLKRVPEATAEILLAEYQIDNRKYLLYPANFWPHKNHEMLLTAFNLFTIRNPHSPLKLVLTGAPGDRMDFLECASRKMGLEDKVIFAGFVDEQTLSVFYQCCLAMIFPSLYEGFGVPLLEAMSFEVPVLSSNLTSLPEVGLDAVHYFDPRKPEEIVEGIELIVNDESYRAGLVQRGKKRIESYLDVNQWAGRYFRVFKDSLAEERDLSNEIFGIYPDHWVGDGFDLTIEEGNENRFLDFNIEVPTWFPFEVLSGRIYEKGKRWGKFSAVRGQRNGFRFPLAGKGYQLKIALKQSFQPKEMGVNDDVRYLSCQVRWCRLITPEGVISIYEAGIQ